MRLYVDYWTAPRGDDVPTGDRTSAHSCPDEKMVHLGLDKGTPHPSSLRHDDPTLPWDRSADWIKAKVNRHTQHNSYCLRSINNGEPYCRFDVPKQKRDDGERELGAHMYADVVNQKFLRWRLYLELLDPLMGTTNEYQVRANRSNVDFKVLVDHLTAIEYVRST